MGTVFNEHGKVPIADGAIHDYGLQLLGHTSATVERYGPRYAPVSTCTSTSTSNTTSDQVLPWPGLVLWPSGALAVWHSVILAHYDHDTELAAMAHSRNGWG